MGVFGLTTALNRAVASQARDTTGALLFPRLTLSALCGGESSVASSVSPRSVMLIDGDALVGWLLGAAASVVVPARAPLVDVPLALYGGDYSSLASGVGALVAAFAAHGVALVAIFDSYGGAISASFKAATSAERAQGRVAELKSASELAAPISTNFVVSPVPPVTPSKRRSAATIAAADAAAVPREGDKEGEAAARGMVTAAAADALRLPWPPQAREQVLASLRSAGALVEIAAGEADALLSRLARRKVLALSAAGPPLPVLGVLSADSDFACCSGLTYFPLSMLALPVAGNLDVEPSLVPVTSTALAAALGLPPARILDLAVLCGNDFTYPHLVAYSGGKAVMDEDSAFGSEGELLLRLALGGASLTSDKAERDADTEAGGEASNGDTVVNDEFDGWDEDSVDNDAADPLGCLPAVRSVIKRVERSTMRSADNFGSELPCRALYTHLSPEEALRSIELWVQPSLGMPSGHAVEAAAWIRRSLCCCSGGVLQPTPALLDDSDATGVSEVGSEAVAPSMDGALMPAPPKPAVAPAPGACNVCSLHGGLRWRLRGIAA